MSFSFEDRTRALLKAVWLEGTLSGAADRLGMDVGNAGRHLRTAEARLGVPLVRRTRGGRGGRNSALTAAGRKWLEAPVLLGRTGAYDEREGVTPIQVGGRTLFAAGRHAPGPVEVLLPPEAVALERAGTRPGASSVRNRFPVRVQRIEDLGNGILNVALSAGSLRFHASIVRGAVRDLALRRGSRLYATFKAVSIQVGPWRSMTP